MNKRIKWYRTSISKHIFHWMVHKTLIRPYSIRFFPDKRLSLSNLDGFSSPSWKTSCARIGLRQLRTGENVSAASLCRFWVFLLFAAVEDFATRFRELKPRLARSTGLLARRAYCLQAACEKRSFFFFFFGQRKEKVNSALLPMSF